MPRVRRFCVGLIVASVSLALGPTEGSAQAAGDVRLAGGLGISFAPDARDGLGLGASLVADYPLVPAVWGGIRLYAGGFASATEESSCPGSVEPCSISSTLAVLGTKVRLLVPIPYVGPYFEVGLGASAGSLETRIGPSGTLDGIDERHSGLMLHVPFSVGLAFGARHQHALSFDYFAHPGRDHVAGAFALGIGFGWG